MGSHGRYQGGIAGSHGKPRDATMGTRVGVARVKTNAERSWDSLLCVMCGCVASRVRYYSCLFLFANLLYEVAAVRRECVRLLLVA